LASDGMFVQSRRAPNAPSLPQTSFDKGGRTTRVVEDLVVDDADDVEVEYGEAPKSSAAPAAASSTVGGSSGIPKVSSGGPLFASTGTPISEAQATVLRQLLTGADKTPLPAFHKSWHQVATVTTMLSMRCLWRYLHVVCFELACRGSFSAPSLVWAMV
jgi:hypothetical protein